MKLKIKTNNDNEIIVYLNNKIELIIGEKRQDLNLQTINKFLVSLATSIPEGEQLEISKEFDEEKEKENSILNHVIYLFSEFAKYYNDSILDE